MVIWGDTIEAQENNNNVNIDDKKIFFLLFNILKILASKVLLILIDLLKILNLGLIRIIYNN